MNHSPTQGYKEGFMSICIIEEVLDIIMPDAIIAIFLQSTKHLKASSAAAARTKDNKDDKNCPNFPHSTAAARTEDNKDDKKLPKLPPFHCCCKNRRQQR
jgi:hypothetical protein